MKPNELGGKTQSSSFCLHHLESSHGSGEASPSRRCVVIALREAVKIRLIFKIHGTKTEQTDGICSKGGWGLISAGSIKGLTPAVSGRGGLSYMHYNDIDLPTFAALKAATRTLERGVFARFSPSSGEPTVAGIRSHNGKAV